jgi:hypothetical protein
MYTLAIDQLPLSRAQSLSHLGTDQQALKRVRVLVRVR